MTDRVEKGSALTEAEVQEYLKDFNVDLTDNAVECYRTIANCAFASFILGQCAKCTLRFLPVPLGSAKDVIGMEICTYHRTIIINQPCEIP